MGRRNVRDTGPLLPLSLFFMRKFWFTYLAKAVVMMPGGAVIDSADPDGQGGCLVESDRRDDVGIPDRSAWIVRPSNNANAGYQRRLLDKLRINGIIIPI